VLLNGEEIFGPRDLQPNIQVLERGVTLAVGQNTLGVRLASAPGSSVRVVIDAQGQ
jgi:hypothetical protein